MINAVFAVDFNGGMGINGTLPWPHHAEDLANFQRLTTNQVVVMGRRTWDDPKMPKPLTNRIVYVATHRPTAYASVISGDLCENLLRLEQQYPDREIFLIGGADLLESAKSILDRVYLTHFKGSYKVDTRIHTKEFLTGFRPILARVSKDVQATFTVYESIFKRTTTL
jgi:dihydrofolate reductase